MPLQGVATLMVSAVKAISTGPSTSRFVPSTVIVVTAYADDASGTMEQVGIGGRFTEVVLRPRVTVADPADVDLATRIHVEAGAA